MVIGVYAFDIVSNFEAFEKFTLFKINVSFLKIEIQVQKLKIRNPLNKKKR